MEKVYENALVHELRKYGFEVKRQVAFQIFYDRVLVGDFAADVVVDDKFIIEIKATEKNSDIYKAQLINYLKASGLTLGFVVNFGKEQCDFQRIV